MSKLDLALIFAGIEDDTQDMVDVGGPEVVENIIAQASDEETAAGDAAEEVAAVIVADVDKAEALQAEAEGIERFADFLLAAGEKGGLGKTAAFAVGMGIEDRLDRVGIALGNVMPGIESFGNEADKEGSTKSFGQKAKDLAARIWAAVVEFVNKVIDKSAELYQRLRAWSPMLVSKAKAVQKSIRDLKEDPQGKEVKLTAKIARKLYMGADATVDVDAAQKSMISVLHAMAVAGTDSVRKVIESATDAIPEEAALSVIMKAAGLPDIKAQVKVGEGYVLHGSTEEFPGGKAVVIVSKKDSEGKGSYRNASAEMRDVHEGAAEKLKEGATIVCPNKGGLEAWATSVLGLAQNTDKVVAGRQSSLKIIKSMADKARAQASKDASAEGVTDEQKKAAKDAAAVVNTLVRVSAKTIDLCSSYALGTVGRGILEAVGLCVKAAGGEAAEDEKKGEGAAATA